MINTIRKITVFARTSVKITLLVILSIVIIVGIIALFYNPTYEVYLNGEMIGYTADKSGVQERINEHINANSQENVAFVQVDAMPTYKLCLLKKDAQTNDDEIFEAVTNTGTKYYKYYAITEEKEEKLYVATFKEAEDIVAELEEKDSNNIDDIGILEKYDTSIKEFTDVEKAVSKLYEERPVYIEYYSYTAPSSSNYTSGSSSQKVEIGLALIQPVSGVITSRFGGTESIRNHAHSGLDIGAPNGTPIKAAAAGTVTYAGNAGDGYGNYVVIAHGNGVQTLYAHCSELLVSSGQQISQGEIVAKVGSTGNSTGNHLHFEVRKDGIAYDPQYYVY